ncbi:MAG: 2-hydroxyacyl-CoA dehydratase [Anaerolineaceae bacterium]|nr:2-hydroxyacyl-CoA dehydratase [Anaerolineaceae bacterium]
MNHLKVGIDIGSTTAKVSIMDEKNQICFTAYRRHHAETVKTLTEILNEAKQQLNGIPAVVQITGSAGMGVAEAYNLPFIQEVVSTASYIKTFYPDVKTVMDIGGEDAKLILFDANGRPDIRMNGSCAGGTGAYLDQMATLLNIPVQDLQTLAEKSQHRHPIASRCGVFGKTDVQNLLSREIPREDIAASVLYAIVLQTMATLARGTDLESQVLFCGGPLTFIPILRDYFQDYLKLPDEAFIHHDYGEMIPSLGSAVTSIEDPESFTLDSLLRRLAEPGKTITKMQPNPPLFKDEEDHERWQQRVANVTVPKINPVEMQSPDLYLGIDSGSTTTKVICIDPQGKIVFTDYRKNHGKPIQAVWDGLKQAQQVFSDAGVQTHIRRTIVTGYGEDLIRTAFQAEEGVVETLAHFRAASYFDDQVSFLLDIGGQDMKALFIENGQIQKIEINEACSSGCGSFLETFAESLGYSVEDFAALACQSQAPCDLGSRCTVFMNSKVKQMVREGATIADLSAGLAYSVVKNALHKVLNITNADVLGKRILVQGGTFRNPAVHKALENLLGREAIAPDIAPLMGAFGAALMARDHVQQDPKSANSAIQFHQLPEELNYSKKMLTCRGCENQCQVTQLNFGQGHIFYAGNRCEKIFQNEGKKRNPGVNLIPEKEALIFNRPAGQGNPELPVIGIPRALNQYENYPFWHTLFTQCGFELLLSDASDNALYEKGVGTVMSENICFPAKLTNGHILNLIEMGVDRIFYPMIFFESKEFDNALNSYNCPIISGYPDVIRSAINPQKRYNIPLDQPSFTFANKELLQKNCYNYFSKFGIKKALFQSAFTAALAVQDEWKESLRSKGEQIVKKARQKNRLVALLISRPYHVDPMINHNIPEILAGFDVDVITEDAVPLDEMTTLENVEVLTQWSYPNRYYHAVRWAAEQDNVFIVQLNSFGCGPDAIAVDEVKSLLGKYGKRFIVLRIDEIESLGSVKLRLRSLIDAMRTSGEQETNCQVVERPQVAVFTEQEKQRLIIAPQFAEFCTSPLLRPFRDMGYKVEVLPEPNRDSVNTGLKYTNNEICYPAIIVIGDLIKALQSGKYNLENVAVAITQTGGACRASSYLSLLKKALIDAGFEQVPIVSLAPTARGLHEQPGFNMDMKQYMARAAISMIYSDSISRLYYATAAREIEKGQAKTLSKYYMSLLDSGELSLAPSSVLQMLEEASINFNRIPMINDDLPMVGIVGEIYAKYNSFSNFYVAEWLIDQRVEVVVPVLLEFFLSWLINEEVRAKTNIKAPGVLSRFAALGEKWIWSFLGLVEKKLQFFRYLQPLHRIRDLATRASTILNLNNQYGESWLIAGEISGFMHQGVENVLCLQPFGCIANQVIAKGVERRIKREYPDLNILFLDVDAGVSEVNFFNRMYFFLDSARKQHAIKQNPPLLSSGD